MNVYRSATAFWLAQHRNGPLKSVISLTTERVLTDQVWAQHQINVGTALELGKFVTIGVGEYDRKYAVRRQRHTPHEQLANRRPYVHSELILFKCPANIAN